MLHSTVTRELTGQIFGLFTEEDSSTLFWRVQENHSQTVLAEQMFLQQERSVGSIPFKTGLMLRLGHAELVCEAELLKPKGEVIYLPTHGVIKESSSITKLHIV